MTRTIDQRVPLHVAFEEACRTLRHDARNLIEPVAGELRLELGGSTVGRGVVLSVGAVDVDEDEARVPVSWRAAHHPHLFPVLEGELQVRREGWADVELRLVGSYRPPFGFLGELGDRVLGHRVADRTVRGFLDSVGQRLVRSSGKRAKTDHRRVALVGGGPATEYRDERTR